MSSASAGEPKAVGKGGWKSGFKEKHGNGMVPVPVDCAPADARPRGEHGSCLSVRKRAPGDDVTCEGHTVVAEREREPRTECEARSLGSSFLGDSSLLRCLIIQWGWESGETRRLNDSPQRYKVLIPGTVWM